MSILKPSLALRNAMVQQAQILLDAGSGPGLLRIYDGSMPASPDIAISSQNLLAELVLSDPCAPAASGGALTFSAITTDTSANATGTATWTRLLDSTGNAVIDCDVTVSGGGGIIQINNPSIVAGGPVQITAFALNMPAS